MKEMAVADLSTHPEAGRVPEMSPVQWAGFVEDIRERGVRVPVEVQPGTKVILDGRSRWLAAKEIGLTTMPVIDAPINGDDPVVYMLRAASTRRHLNDDQRATIAEEEEEYLAKKSKAERASKAGSAGGKVGGRNHPKKSSGSEENVSPKPETKPKGRARGKAAASHNTSEWKVRQARKVRAESPKLAKEVKDGKKTLAQASRELDRKAKAKAREEAAEKAASAPVAERLWDIRVGDCLEELARIESGTASLVFADPPYNIGIDYGCGKKADQLPESDYLDWCSRWFAECHRILDKNGTAWVLINSEWADHFGVMLHKAGFHRRAWVGWYETFGVCNSGGNNFSRCLRHLFYCVKNARKFTFHKEAVTRPSDRQTKYNDARAEPGGKVWDDVWEIPRLVGTAKERIEEFPTQLPLGLLLPIVDTCSEPGSLVVDPFNGSGTTGAACIQLRRRYIGIEKSERFAELARQRLLIKEAGE